MTLSKDIPKKPPTGLQFCLEIVPLLLFFLSYRYGNLIGDTIPGLAGYPPLMIATACLIVATLASLLGLYFLTSKVPIMPLITALIVSVFGILTIFFNDDTFIKIKPTLIYSLFAIVLFGGLWFKKPLLPYIFSPVLQINQEGWIKLTRRWALFFIALAFLNESIWRFFSTDFWVSFKVFGFIPLTVLFMLFQMPLIYRHMLDKEL